MAKRFDGHPRPSRYAPLVAHLGAHAGESVLLTFPEIEAIIGVPLSDSAQVSPAIWSGASRRLVRDLRAIDWRASLRAKQHAVAFRRVAGEREG